MTSIAYLGGGGDDEQEAAVWRLMLAARPRVLYWPFALEPERLADAEVWFRGSVQSHQRDLHVETWTSLDGHRRADLDAFDLLFIGGGNTYDLLAHLRAHDGLTWVRSFLAGGGAVYGGSAGAVLLGSTIAIAEGHDPNTTGLTTPEELAGLGLLPRHAVLPHYTNDQQDHAQRWSAEHGLEVLGVPETAGLVIQDDVVTVVGDGPVRRLTAGAATPLQPGRTFSAVDDPTAPATHL